MYGPSEGFLSKAANKDAMSPLIREYMNQEDITFEVVDAENYTEYLVEKCELISSIGRQVCVVRIQQRGLEHKRSHLVLH